MTTQISPDEAFAQVYNDTKKYPTLSDVASALGCAYKTVKNKASLLRARANKGDEDVPTLISRQAAQNEPAQAGVENREITSIPPSPDEPIADLLSRIIQHNERYDAYHTHKQVVDVQIKIDGPFGVVGLPDHHLDNVGTMLKRALDDAELINKHPHLLAVGIGDWIDNFIIGFLEKVRRKNVMSHSDSWRILEYYLDLLYPKLIAAISGNHMDWSTSGGGVDIMKRMFEERGLGAIYDTDEVRVRLTTPSGAQFTHLARHKYRGNSQYNAVHAITKWILENWQGEDVIWGGHIHTAGHCSLQKQFMGETRTVHGVQLGAYKKHDDYARREAFRQNTPFLTPMTVHVPETGKTLFFDDIHDGVKHLEWLRKDLGYSV